MARESGKIWAPRINNNIDEPRDEKPVSFSLWKKSKNKKMSEWKEPEIPRNGKVSTNDPHSSPPNTFTENETARRADQADVISMRCSEAEEPEPEFIHTREIKGNDWINIFCGCEL